MFSQFFFMHHLFKYIFKLIYLLGGNDCFSFSAFSLSSTTKVYKNLLHLTLNLRLFLFFFILIALKKKEYIKKIIFFFFKNSFYQILKNQISLNCNSIFNTVYSMKRCQLLDHHFFFLFQFKKETVFESI
jgi:hypothetical protein